MKNKKLFAILTLVCFMFTLMPVAAFAAPGDYAYVADNYTTVQKNGEVKVNFTNAKDYYVYATDANGNLYTDLAAKSGLGTPVKGIAKTTAATTTSSISFAAAGTYTVYATIADSGLDKIVEKYLTMKLHQVKFWKH